MSNILLNTNRETKTRFITSEYSGAPLLKNEYGSLVNLLNIVLTKGFNSVNIISLRRDLITNLVTLQLNRGHNFILNQVVTISNCAEESFNGDFRILESRATTVTIYSEGIEETSDSTEALIKISSLGFTSVFENETKSIQCFKNASTESPGILKVIDEIPPNGYSTNWGKYARVVFGQDIDELGNFIDNNKSPYWSEFPDVEVTGNGISAGPGIHGFAKWDYVTHATYYHSWETYGGPYGVYPTKWKIIGDDKTFYILVWSRGTQYAPTILGFGNYIPENPEETSNLCLQARNSNLTSDNRANENYARTRNEFGVLEGTFGGFLLSNAFGQTKDITASGRYRCESLLMTSGDIYRPWRSSGVQSVNPVTGSWLTNKLFIKDSENYLRGYHRGVQIMYGTSRLSEGSMSLEGDIVLYVQTPLGSSEHETMPLLFSLRDWEHIE